VLLLGDRVLTASHQKRALGVTTEPVIVTSASVRGIRSVCHDRPDSKTGTRFPVLIGLYFQFFLVLVRPMLVSWSLTSLFSTMAISETRLGLCATLCKVRYVIAILYVSVSPITL